MSYSMKAIKITEDNYSSLAGLYEADEDLFKDAAGLFLVADFGEGKLYDLVRLEDMNKSFTKTGRELQNGYFEVLRR